MIGSSVPGMNVDVLRADIAARQGAAQAHWEAEAMRRELSAARHEARRAHRHALLARLRQASATHIDHFIHGSPA